MKEKTLSKCLKEKTTISEMLNKAIGQALTSYDVSDDGTCVVLLFEDMDVPMLVNLSSKSEIETF